MKSSIWHPAASQILIIVFLRSAPKFPVAILSRSSAGMLALLATSSKDLPASINSSCEIVLHSHVIDVLLSSGLRGAASLLIQPLGDHYTFLTILFPLYKRFLALVHFGCS